MGRIWESARCQAVCVMREYRAEMTVNTKKKFSANFLLGESANISPCSFHPSALCKLQLQPSKVNTSFDLQDFPLSTKDVHALNNSVSGATVMHVNGIEMRLHKRQSERGGGVSQSIFFWQQDS